jgi:protein-disulfide isomerase
MDLGVNVNGELVIYCNFIIFDGGNNECDVAAHKAASANKNIFDAVYFAHYTVLS